MFLLEAPALQGSPIEHVGVYAFYPRDVLRLVPLENPQRHGSSNLPLLAEIGKIAPYLSVIHVNIEQAKYRRIRCGSQSVGQCRSEVYRFPAASSDTEVSRTRV